MAFQDQLPSHRRRTELGRRSSALDPITSLQEEMNRLFDDLFLGAVPSAYRQMEKQMAEFAPSIDVSETGKAIKITAELPGMEEKDISLTLEEDHLILAGERKEEKSVKLMRA
jgi:HSP20 family protein